jgi:acyl carrier protein
MNREQIEQTVNEMIAATLDREAGTFDRTTHLYDELLMDSLDHVGLVMALEDDYDVAISDEESERWRTVGDVIDFIERIV